MAAAVFFVIIFRFLFNPFVDPLLSSLPPFALIIFPSVPYFQRNTFSLSFP